MEDAGAVSPGGTEPYRVSIQSSIQAALASYPPSMRRIADALLDRPQVVLDHTISELARSCSTSETSVVRFSRTLGFTGFAPMKLQMAAELAKEAAQSGTPAGHGADISPADSLAEAVAKVASSEILGIQETAANLDLGALQRVADAIDRAGRTLLFGIGASHAGAHDLSQKLLRIGRVALDLPDAHDAMVSANLLKPGDVAIAFSHSGRTRESTEVLRAARESGALAVAVTNGEDSPLTRAADEVLGTAVRETTFRSGAMASRIAQLTVVDYLFVAVARGDYEHTVQALRSTYDSVRALRDDR